VTSGPADRETRLEQARQLPGGVIEPAVSVVMPVFNAAPYLEAAILSILSQSFANFEFLIFNDGSTDESPEIVRHISATDSRIRFFDEAHRGYARWLNEGIRLARGHYVARMDADDVAMPARFERQLAYLREHPECVAVGCTPMFIDPAGRPTGLPRYSEDHEEIEAEFLRGEGGAILHPAAMFPRAALLRIGGYREDLETAEDYDLFLRLAEHGRLANLPEVLLHYRHHPRSVGFLQHTRQNRIVEGIVREARERRDLPPIILRLPDRPPGMADVYQRAAVWAAGTGRRTLAVQHALNALRLAPASLGSWRSLSRALVPNNLVRALKRFGG